MDHATSLRCAVEKLFANAREAEPHERNAMAYFVGNGLDHSGLQYAIFVAFLNGYVKTEAREPMQVPIRWPRVRSSTVAAVRAQNWPTDGTLLWRQVPVEEDGLLYMRCVVVPKGWVPLSAEQVKALG